ncbi:DEAD/DEAH box helicase [Nocardioides sp. R-C-SC26]|uniref:DEAD/DEAH box helicase n=1 Tax=Nocardioides sp. R-C-SC26 TaxID=2870414 RepID=UPI0027DFA0B2|nr:DEAD/DEAH box helicase [Nocardioides sp. R-C-SC26]
MQQGIPPSRGSTSSLRRAPDEAFAHILAAPGRRERLTHLEVLPRREARHSTWPEWADPDVVAALRARGVDAPWTHQARAADRAWSGEHVVLATGTASGKSLAYQVPALTASLRSRGSRGQRGASTLYLAPTKALAHDQWRGIDALGLGVRAAPCDGDSTREERDWVRSHAELVLTNPDMLHRSMLPGHERWTALWRTLRFVVVDECHAYRGVFGAHVAHVLRRLRRVCASYGTEPTFVLTSATSADPGLTATRLVGAPVAAVTDDGSPRGALTLGLWEPPLTDRLDEFGAPVRRSTASETADLLADLVVEGVPTLAFVRSRSGVEQVAMTTANLVAEVDPELAGQVAAYRGGYLPEERRAIEADLRSGRLLGLAATNALELGIDVPGLDAVLIAGFPGTRAAFWQQLGRAGRGADDAVGVFIARDDPLDTYLVHHPDALVGRPVEASVFDPANPHVLAPHLCAAAQEIPLRRGDLSTFGDPVAVEQVVRALVADGRLRRRPHGWFWTSPDRAADLVDIRSAGGRRFDLVESETGRVVGHVDAGRAHGTAHTGAVYVHRGETWIVDELDLDDHVAVITRRDPGYTTSTRERTDITIREERVSTTWGACRVAFGEVEVEQQVVSFLKRRTPSGEVMGEVPLDLPASTLVTSAVWWTVPAEVLAETTLDADALPGSAHAAEHCSIGLLPLFATCDRWDIGGVSTALHPDTGELTVFVHDGQPGGAGFAERGFGEAARWLRATREVIATCECAEGCPSCVQSPKCGNQNNPLDKAGAVTLLDALLRGAPPEVAAE